MVVPSELCGIWKQHSFLVLKKKETGPENMLIRSKKSDQKIWFLNAWGNSGSWLSCSLFLTVHLQMPCWCDADIVHRMRKSRVSHFTSNFTWRKLVVMEPLEMNPHADIFHQKYLIIKRYCIKACIKAIVINVLMICLRRKMIFFGACTTNLFWLKNCPKHARVHAFEVGL